MNIQILQGLFYLSAEVLPQLLDDYYLTSIKSCDEYGVGGSAGNASLEKVDRTSQQILKQGKLQIKRVNGKSITLWVIL